VSWNLVVNYLWRRGVNSCRWHEERSADSNVSGRAVSSESLSTEVWPIKIASEDMTRELYNVFVMGKCTREKDSLGRQWMYPLMQCVLRFLAATILLHTIVSSVNNYNEMNSVGPYSNGMQTKGIWSKFDQSNKNFLTERNCSAVRSDPQTSNGRVPKT